MTYRRWRALRRSVQALSFLLCVWLVIYTLPGVSAPLPPDALLRVDPLAALAAMIASRQFLVRFIPGVALLLVAFLLGRFWCGWLCPLGTFIEWTSPASAAGH